METSNHCQFVDLGLPVKWATCNIGAKQPHELGYLFAWGETHMKSIYLESNYKFAKKDSCGTIHYTQYNPSDILDQDDDIAYRVIGEDFRIPSLNDWSDLFDNCSTEYRWIGGHRGILFTSKLKGYNNKSIFIPLVGLMENGVIEREGENTLGLYWTNSIDETYIEYADAADLSKVNSRYVNTSFNRKLRWSGLPVRAIRIKWEYC